ncbi:MAG: hypothetical protein UW21_C0018G0005 [Candidatus Woesebacteria bacterium GW2011_GWB1_44_11b]|uniref:Uncharacterized protein n=1 Tax=Candidatus Woesebacteria bacterium GW2011_GWB1_44_11b TaxID=1618580 RepID=A0A0G1JBL7_9BACT|nr:MAG: hypothetical protein UW21_C0018G0005 [Candidatus Woesebacteria bacterium GW2011_GWB1_44_11b]
MKRFWLFSLFLVILLFPESVQASLLVVDKNGEVTWKVLALESGLEIPDRGELQVKDIAYSQVDPNAQISLYREGDRFQLKVASGGDENNLDVTDIKTEVVEIEERPQTQRIKIGILEDKFSIEQKGIIALTSYPINIDPDTAHLSVTTDSGVKFISVLPIDAVSAVMRSKILSSLNEKKHIFLEESEGREPSYLIEGEKKINVFNVFDYSVAVKAVVSASTGEILSVDQPAWLKVLGFLFT